MLLLASPRSGWPLGSSTEHETVALRLPRWGVWRPCRVRLDACRAGLDATRAGSGQEKRGMARERVEGYGGSWVLFPASPTAAGRSS